MTASIDDYMARSTMAIGAATAPSIYWDDADGFRPTMQTISATKEERASMAFALERAPT